MDWTSTSYLKWVKVTQRVDNNGKATTIKRYLPILADISIAQDYDNPSGSIITYLNAPRETIVRAQESMEDIMSMMGSLGEN